MKVPDYFLVHNPMNRMPTKQHFNKSDAITEAKRLAKLHVGHKFFVLEAITCYATVQPEPEEIEIDKEDYQKYRHCLK